MHILFLGMETSSWRFHDLTWETLNLPSPAGLHCTKSLRRHETIWRVGTLPAQPSPIGTSGRIQGIVPCGCLFLLAGDWQVGGTLGRVVLPAGQSSFCGHAFPPLREFHPHTA